MAIPRLGSLSAQTAFFVLFFLFLLMQFAVTASAPHTIFFYVLVTPAALCYLWQNRGAGYAVAANPAIRAFALFFAFIAIHAYLHDDPAKVMRNALETALFLYLATLFFSAIGHEGRQRLLIAIGLVAGLCAAASILLYLTDPKAEIRLRPIGRADTQVLGAFVYSMGAICALAALHWCRSMALALMLAGAIVLCLAIVVLTQSRMALAALLGSLVLGGIWLCKDKKRHLFVAGGLVALMIAVVIAVWGDMLYVYANTLMERGDSFRGELWSVTLAKILQHPWLGHGMMAGIDYQMTATFHTNSPHNIFLATALALGFPGLLLLLWALIVLARTLLRRGWWQEHFTFFACLLILTCTLASGMIDHSRIVKGPSPLWIVFWLPLAMGIASSIRHGNHQIRS